MLFNSLWYHKFRQLVFSEGGILGLAQDPFSVLFFFFGKSSKLLSVPGFFPGFSDYKTLTVIYSNRYCAFLCRKF
ncbi:hypothetical protein LEP1GSC188_0563 [Leptospira weilii serovar Topaz str. LT2116]|uniref:Uncharacterized protein n=1 Tax=Leptospira weilii serovar Topaz str. LT2116 TaxID=1088540 RepID=M3ENF7_9LEPT|nr:hypothetical protein LEP1GSC188_0563 [Leptospira weilii serovar Topaz str. LT2116]